MSGPAQGSLHKCRCCVSFVPAVPDGRYTGTCQEHGIKRGPCRAGCADWEPVEEVRDLLIEMEGERWTK